MKEIEIYLICFLSSLIGSGLGIFISAFLKKKGENLATKQDIESITKKIENVKFNLSKKLEILKISQAEIQLKKTEVFIEFSEVLVDVLTHKIKADSKIFKNKVNKLGLNIFFFGSEETIRNFQIYKSQKEYKNDKMSPLITLANLYISMRKDLGFTESELTPDDFLKILITDWDQAKLKNLQEN